MSTLNIQDEVATTCTVASLLISGYQIARHLSNYNEPHLQLYIIRILMMIPVGIFIYLWLVITIWVVGLLNSDLAFCHDS